MVNGEYVLNRDISFTIIIKQSAIYSFFVILANEILHDVTGYQFIESVVGFIQPARAGFYTKPLILTS